MTIHQDSSLCSMKCLCFLRQNGSTLRLTGFLTKATSILAVYGSPPFNSGPLVVGPFNKGSCPACRMLQLPCPARDTTPKMRRKRLTRRTHLILRRFGLGNAIITIEILGLICKTKWSSLVFFFFFSSCCCCCCCCWGGAASRLLALLLLVAHNNDCTIVENLSRSPSLAPLPHFSLEPVTQIHPNSMDLQADEIEALQCRALSSHPCVV